MTQITLPLSTAKAICTFAGRIIDKKIKNPVFGCILFTGTGSIAITDLDMVGECYGVYLVETPHAPFVLPLTAVQKLIAGAEVATDLALTVRKDGYIDMKCDGVQSTITALPAEDFPVWQGIDEKNTWLWYSTDGGDFSRHLSLLAPCISDEHTRYNLRGVYLASLNNKFSMVSTDGHKLALIETDTNADRGTGEGSIWPAKAVKVVQSLIGKGRTKDYITLSASPSRVRVEGPGWKIESKCLDGSYPDFVRVLPGDAPSDVLSVNPKSLAKVAKRLAGMSAGSRYPAGIFDFAKTEVVLADAGTDVRADIPGALSLKNSGALFLRLNLKYVSELFGTADKAGVSSAEIEATTAERPIAVRMPGARFMVMPLRGPR